MSLPKSLQRSLLGDDTFCESFAIRAENVFHLGPGAAVEGGRLFAAVRAAYRADSAEAKFLDEAEREWRVEVQDDKSVLCILADDVRILPESRFLSEELGDRLAALRVFVGDKLNSDESERWKVLLEAGPLSDDEMLRLHVDVGETPSSFVENMVRRLEGRSATWSDVVPESIEYADRLLGPSEFAQSLNEFEAKGLPTQWASLANLGSEERVRRTLLLCGAASNVGAVPLIDETTLVVDALADLAISSRSPMPKVAMIEVLLPRAGSSKTVENALTRLIEHLLSLNPTVESACYPTFSNLLVGTYGLLSVSSSFSTHSAFYRYLLSMSHAGYLQERLGDVGLDLEEFSQELAKSFGGEGLCASALDIREYPRWNLNFADGHTIWMDHLGRISKVAHECRGSIPAGELRDLLFDADAALRAAQNPLICSRPSILEGGIEMSAEVPDEFATAIREQLEEGPVSVNCFTGLINFQSVSPLPIELLELAAKRLLDARSLLDGFETPGQAQHFFLSMASAAAIGRSTKLADRLNFVVRAHSSNVKHRLPLDIAMVIGVIASAAHASSEAADQWLGEFASQLAFEVQEPSAAKKLLGCMKSLCRVRPSLRTQLGKSIAAARAASWLGD
ncbi:hypothetical protein [Maricaulis sp.]|uniref:hypothetical protein n=1 Tax=Maricaulis sp. TaxID=1486257 RepID=UPI003A8F7BB7